MEAQWFSIAEDYHITFPKGDVQDDLLSQNFISLSPGMWDQLKEFPAPVDSDMVA